MVDLNRKVFYDSVRHSLFGGALRQSQVDGMEALIDDFERVAIDTRWFAYVLATAFHETAQTMEPIEEYGRGRGRSYGVPDPQTHQTYYGRGFVQLTHKKNYETMGRLIGVDLVNHPELALNADNATKIIFAGMEQGLFTGKKLKDYFDDSHSDWYNARRIVNGLDRAARIAGYGVEFYKAILTSLKAAPTESLAPPDRIAEARAREPMQDDDWSIDSEAQYLLNVDV